MGAHVSPSGGSRLRPMLPSIALALLLGLLAAAGCSENQPSGFAEYVQNPSSQPKFLTPAPGASGVSPAPEIHVGYESELDYSRATPDVIQLFDLGPTLTTPTRVAVAILASEDGRGFDVMPIGQLAAPRTFEVRILGRTQGLRFKTGADLDDASFRFTTAGDPTFTTAAGPLAGAPNGGFYSASIAASGGAPPLSFAITEGTLPGGLSLDLATGSISGVAQNATASPLTYRFAVTVTDAIGRTGSRFFTITVAP